MSEDSDALRDNVRLIPTELAKGALGSGPLLPPGGGGDGIEARLAKLEAGQEYIDRRLTSLEARAEAHSAALARIETSIAVISTRLEHLPSKGWTVSVFAAVGTAIALIVALLTVGDRLVDLFR